MRSDAAHLGDVVVDMRSPPMFTSAGSGGSQCSKHGAASQANSFACQFRELLLPGAQISASRLRISAHCRSRQDPVEDRLQLGRLVDAIRGTLVTCARGRAAECAAIFLNQWRSAISTSGTRRAGPARVCVDRTRRAAWSERHRHALAAAPVIAGRPIPIAVAVVISVMGDSNRLLGGWVSMRLVGAIAAWRGRGDSANRADPTAAQAAIRRCAEVAGH